MGCPTCCYQVCALGHANVGTADLHYSSGPCHRNETNIFKLFNLLWTTDARRWDESGSTLARAMTCCLLAPSHFLILEWPILIGFYIELVWCLFHRKWLEYQYAKVSKYTWRNYSNIPQGPLSEWAILVVVTLRALLLTHYDLVTTHHIKLGQHCLGLWLVSPRCHAIVWPSDVL